MFRLSFLEKGARNPLPQEKPISRDISGEELGIALSAAKYWASVINPMDCPETASASCAARVIFSAGDEYSVEGRPRILSGLSADYNLVLSQSVLAQGVPRGYNFNNSQDYAIAVTLGDYPYNLEAASLLPGGAQNLFSLFVRGMMRGLGLYSLKPIEIRSGGKNTQFGQLVQRGQLTGEGWYFNGVNASTIYGDGTLRPVPMKMDGPDARWDLFELRNTLLSASSFCNYSVPVALELSALMDLGYDLELGRVYGRSIYTDGTTVANGTGFMSSVPYGLGLHVYGSFNTVLQEADLSASGKGAGGIRIDGRSNNLTVSPNSEVKGSGALGTGILVAYGSEHTLNIQGSVYGEEDALRFDIGLNLLDSGELDADGYGKNARYSFFQADSGAGPEQKDAVSMLAGPLVKILTVAGLIQSQKRAIYISPNSYVETLSFVKGASIFGDIISDYDNMGKGAARVTSIYVGGSTEAFDKADPDFSMVISGKILGSGKIPMANAPRRYIGRGLIDLILVGGKTTIPDTGRIDVKSVKVLEGAVMEIRPDLANLRPVFLEAESVTFSQGAVIRVSESTSLKKGAVSYFTPLLKVTKRGAEDFVNDATLELDPDSSLKGGELAWFMSGANDHLLVYVFSKVE
ncbi:MAG: hypothetical protein LBE27_03240 [Deltaproteobacteria bacterium]|nr:hypothetical protein [Deltaproteobacteria bacterium]